MVCKDNLLDLEVTLDSIRDLIDLQSEIIVVDSSKNRAIANHLETLKLPNLKYIYMPPSGIYSAMEEGVSNSSPQNYVWFLNPGDVLKSSDHLIEIVTLGASKYMDWIYGQAEISSSHLEAPFPSNSEKHTFKSLVRGKLRISHQAMLVKNEAFKHLQGFDNRYVLCADLDFQFRLFDNFQGLYFNKVLAAIDPNGISHQKIIRVYFETFLIRYRSGRMSPPFAFLFTLKNLLVLFLRKLRRRLFESKKPRGITRNYQK